MALPFSLVVCTYMRAEALIKLLGSVEKQTLYPDEIIIVDGSLNDETKEALIGKNYKNIRYYLVGTDLRGLTKQRNFGITKIARASAIVCFLDDDVILESDYFEVLLSSYKTHPKALAIGGYITNEVNWNIATGKKDKDSFYYDGWMRKEPSRFKIRKKVGLAPDTPPGYLPTFSHGRSISFLPPSGKTYKVEQIMGGVSSYRTLVFEKIKFSTYFEGYGLYEDTDFSLRLAKIGDLYLNTNAKLAHYHESSGRPNQYHYGKMVVRNGWYVWKVKYPNPKPKPKLKFHATVLLLALVRATNVLTTRDRKKALTETIGRLSGWFSIIFNPPKIE